jgi:hypothetical protein
MRVSHFLSLAMLAAAAACHDNGVTVNERPPLGGVRFINAVADGGPVDIRMVDQIEWSANSVSNGSNYGLPFRAGTIHWATEAKARHIRVFPTDSSIAITSTVLHDTTITIEANKNVTLMLVGSRAAGGKVSFIMIDDTPPAVTSNQVAIRLVNASRTGQTPATASGYITADTLTALPATATWGTVGPLSASPYVVQSTGKFAIQTTPAGSTASVWKAAAPDGAPATGLIGATAGALGGGSALSAYLFPPSGTGPFTPQSGTPPSGTTPRVVFFVDLIPTPPM